MSRHSRTLGLLLLLVGLFAGPGLRAQETPPIERFELKKGRIGDAVHLLSELTGRNIVATTEAADREVTILLRNLPVDRVIETLCKITDLWYREDDGVTRIMTSEEYQKDLVVLRDSEIRVFTLLHPNAVTVASSIRDLFGDRVTLSFGLQEEELFGDDRQGGTGLGTTSLSGSTADRFSDRFGGFGTTRGGRFGTRSQFSGQGQRGREEEAETLAEEKLTPERLARLKEKEGQVTGNLKGLTEGPPPIAVTVDRRHNVIAIRTSDQDALEDIEALIGQLDRPTPQVLLEMKILELRLGDDFETALDLDFVNGPNRTDPGTNKQTHPLDATATRAAESLLATGNFPVTGGTLVYQFLNDHIRVRLQALEEEDRIATLASPLLLCANDEVARIFIGEERPLVRNFQLQTTTTDGVSTERVVPTVDLRDIGNTLRIIPRINADRTVTLTIIQDISQLNEDGATLPVPGAAGGLTQFDVDTVTTSNLEGTVVASDGKTLAVGGLIRKEMEDRLEGIPYLMDIPVLGWLFGSTVRRESQTELVLLITPHVLMTPAEGQARTRARLQSLSIHPYHDLGDAALQRYDRSDVPGSAGYRRMLEDYLRPVPEPMK